MSEATTTNPVVRSSRRLPSGRAVIGALFVTLAVFGVLLASRLGEDATFQLVTVASQDISPGTVLGPDNTGQARIRLDEGVTSVIADPSEIYGAVLLGPVAERELVQRANVATLDQAIIENGFAVVSMKIEPERSPSSLRPGEVVSVFATFNNPDTTELIADRVTVVSYSTDDDGFGDDGVLRLGTADGTLAAELIHAASTGDISIVGITGAADVELPDSVQ